MTRATAELLLAVTPLVICVVPPGLIVNAVFGPLICLNAGRASGESMAQILEDFERR